MNYTKRIIISVFCASVANAYAGVTCPTVVKVGQSLSITAEFTNDDCHEDFVVKNSVLSLVGNSGSALGLQGPFVTPLNAIIPHATCTQIPYDPEYPEDGSYTRVIKGSQTLENLTVIKKIPASMKGTLALATAGVLNAENSLNMAGSCLVTVK
ncbi:MAG: hypothetical protein HOP34_09420 [Methylococcaceae bacterium]|nr:hypothetical protein [Methylococcaceae bacterium]